MANYFVDIGVLVLLMLIALIASAVILFSSEKTETTDYVAYLRINLFFYDFLVSCIYAILLILELYFRIIYIDPLACFIFFIYSRLIIAFWNCYISLSISYIIVDQYVEIQKKSFAISRWLNVFTLFFSCLIIIFNILEADSINQAIIGAIWTIIGSCSFAVCLILYFSYHTFKKLKLEAENNNPASICKRIIAVKLIFYPIMYISYVYNVFNYFYWNN